MDRQRINLVVVSVCAVISIGLLLLHEETLTSKSRTSALQSAPTADLPASTAVSHGASAPHTQTTNHVQSALNVCRASTDGTQRTNICPDHAHEEARTANESRRRRWDPGFLPSLGHPAQGTPIRFELVGGRFAVGVVALAEVLNGELIRVSGTVTEPEKGRFFFQKQTLPGKAGDYVGLVELPGSKMAYRLEPSQAGTELVEHPLEAVICYAIPPVDQAMLSETTERVPPLEPQDVPDLVPPYNDGIISLQSLQGAKGVLYIDYRGGYTSTWGGITYSRPNVNNTQIKDVWKRVAEDYMPFNINVTTDIRVYESAPENSRQRCVVTPTTDAAPGAGGVAYMGSWDWTGDTPCWAFYSTGKSAAEVISHEVGHTLDLGHDGRGDPINEGYFGGHGSGEVGWAPIMGVGYYKNVAQWSKGEYQYANNTEDDLYKIVNNNNNVDYRADDTGALLATARYLDVASDSTAAAEGVIETTADTDAFRFTTTGGALSLTAIPVGDWSDLAIQATLANEAGVVLATDDPQNTLWARISTNLVAGTYTFCVTGSGRNSAFTNGFSSYASLGYYSITGTVANARLSDFFSLPEESTNNTVVGVVTPNPPTADPFVYAITSGNISGAFAIDNAGVLRVANASALNYEALATNTQLAVRYELFITLSNTVTTLAETDRRVVVTILDVNESPTITGFNATILAHSQVGAPIGSATASDPDYYSFVNFSIAAGNTGNAFAIASGTGAMTVAADIQATTQEVYTLTVRAIDNGIPALTNDAIVRVTVLPNTTGLFPGSIAYAVYDAIGSATLITNLTLHARFPNDASAETLRTKFEGAIDRADNYGAALRGYLLPPASGTYTFWIASDDNSELLLSPTTNPATATRIAYVSDWTSPRQWTKFASQRSTNCTLLAGQAYYIEARVKEGGGGDNIAVAWAGPATGNQTNVIEGLYLAPCRINYLPHPSGFTATVRRNMQAGTKIGRVTVADLNTSDTHTLSIASGNTGGLFSMDADGWIRLADDSALPGASSPVTLTIQARDNGSPQLTGTSTVVMVLASESSVSATQLHRERFNAIGSGSAVADLTGQAKYPMRPDGLEALTAFQAPVNVADAFGSRIRGWVTPPADGHYTFFVASDDASQLKFSLTTNAATASVIASVSGYVGAGVYTQYASQISPVQSNLVAGQHYYIETLHKEGGGGDHVSVAWAGPGLSGTNVIAGTYLTPIDINYAPVFTNHAFNLHYTNAVGSVVGRLSVTDSPLDTLTFKIVSGNSNDCFALNVDTGMLSLSNKPLTQRIYSLLVAVQDSGYGHLYPLKTTMATVTVTSVGYSVTGFTSTIRRDLQSGSRVGKITVANDAARGGGTTNFTVLAGNGTGAFSVGADGWVRVANEPGLLIEPSPVSLVVFVSDAGYPPLAHTVTNLITLVATNALPATPYRELFNGITGVAISDLTNNAKYPKRPDALAAMTSFSSPINIADNYGSRVRALLVPTTNSHYRFFIATDDAGQLKFSRSADPAGASQIASVSGWVGANIFAQYASQISPVQSNLVAGASYYIEALQKEAGGGDHVQVAWTIPGVTATNVIPGSYLQPVDINFAPTVSNHLFAVHCTNRTGYVVGQVLGLDSPLDTLSFKISAGNTNSTFAIQPETGVLSLADDTLLTTRSVRTFVLTVTVQDSGYGGLYPLHAASMTVTVSLIIPPTLFRFE